VRFSFTIERAFPTPKPEVFDEHFMVRLPFTIGISSIVDAPPLSRWTIPIPKPSNEQFAVAFPFITGIFLILDFPKEPIPFPITAPQFIAPYEETFFSVEVQSIGESSIE
jgi:hypothetical protein